MIHTHYLGFTYHDKESASLEEMAAKVRLSESRQVDGILYARKQSRQLGNDSIKHSARMSVGGMYMAHRWPGNLRILTMPGIYWQFEKWLIGQRSQVYPLPTPLEAAKATTTICSVENDAAVFRIALRDMPRKKREPIRQVGALAVGSDRIKEFRCEDVEAYITHPHCAFFDAAWFDFTGPLVPARMEALLHFWRTHLGCQMTVTFLAARYPLEIGALLRKHAEDWSVLLSSVFEANICAARRYVDRVPMYQVTLRKPEARAELRYLGYEPHHVNLAAAGGNRQEPQK